ncbi:MAG: beta-galactosidase [Candidatus Hydrogenedentes bacterium]|nr:beta-galactosidase [Candidatus Hydrogenedentota bacterium]
MSQWWVGLAVGLLVGLTAGAGWSAESAKALRQGRLYVDGEWVFLKIGKPLRNFADAGSVDQLIADLPIIQEKAYNCLELNCYWHHFDPNGDGEIDMSLDPLRRLIDAITARGMFACLSVETYGVGGGTVPAGFWERHPDAIAVNAEGREVRDTEYGFGSAVPSQFAPAYLEASRRYIENLTAALPHEKLLYFETTVEPQYIGNQNIDYSIHARRAYEAWRAKAGGVGPPWPEAFPVPEAFRTDPVWSRFRAEALADWVNGDAAAFRRVAGEDAWIAVDYLETGGPEMPNRNGDSMTFLERLTGVNILQVNWHWHVGRRAPNEVAYRNVAAIGRDWAVAEHMTLNGSDYRPEEVPAMLRNTLERGTRFGWEFVNLGPGTNAPFSLYNDDWTPKPLMAEVDGRWDAWMAEVRAGAE